MKRRKWLLAFLIFNFAFAATAFGVGGGGGEAAHGSPVMEWVWRILNFAVLVFILVKFLGKPLKGFLRQRTELIEKTLKEAEAAKELAQKALHEVEERLKVKDKEIDEIITAATRSGEKEKDSIIEQGNKLKEKILEQAKINIDYELKHAKGAIKAEAVEIAMELAEKKIKGKLTKEEQERLLEESLQKMGGRN